ncbi:hypothetical protein ACT4US_20720, partial [Bacillus sp. HC-Mk]
MNSEVKTLHAKETISHPSLWDTLKKHYELVFALASGIFLQSYLQFLLSLLHIHQLYKQGYS